MYSFKKCSSLCALGNSRVFTACRLCCITADMNLDHMNGRGDTNFHFAALQIKPAFPLNIL